MADFDRSPDTLRAQAQASRVPWVAANASGGAGGGSTPFRVVDTAGLRVALLGYVTPDVQTMQPAERLGGLRFGEGELALHDALAGARRAGPGLTVLLAYADADCDSLACEGEVVRLAEQLGRSGVDLIVTGRGVQAMDTRVAGIPIVGPGGPGGLAVADVVKTPAGGREVRVRVERLAAGTPAAGSPLAAVVKTAETATTRWSAEWSRDSSPRSSGAAGRTGSARWWLLPGATRHGPIWAWSATPRFAAGSRPDR